jgi:hypothetical protein
METALMTRLVESAPVRPLRLARRALTGRVAMGGGGTAGYESSLERDWLMALDFDWRVTRILEQPYTLSYVLDGRLRRYTPDVLAEFDDGDSKWTIVYEVKPREDLHAGWAEHRPRYKAAVRDCRAKGWRFRIVTERDIRTPFVANIKFLRRYRDLPVQALHKQALLYTLPALGETTPQALLAATWLDQERRMSAVPELWRLVGNRTIAASLLEPLTMATRIWLP